MPHAVIFHGSIPPLAKDFESVLRRLGLEVLPLAPSRLPLLPAKSKSDRRDSRALAELGESGLLDSGRLRPVHVPTLEEEAVREIMRVRGILVRRRSGFITAIKSRLGRLGIDYGNRRFRPAFKSRLKTQTMPEGFRIVIDSFFDNIEDVTKRIRVLEKECVTHFAGPARDRATLYRTSPAIGPVTAMVLSTEIGDLCRFPSPETLTAFVGLCPSERSSGETERKGRITREGNTRARAALVEAAWRLIRLDPAMRRFYSRIAARRGAKRAAVAVARKILHALWAMSRTGEVWRKAA